MSGGRVRDTGVGHSRKGELDRAIADSTEALRLNPRLTLAYLGRAADYDQTGRRAMAVAACTEAVRPEPDNVLALTLRATAYRALGDRARAEADERKVRELDARARAGKAHNR